MHPAEEEIAAASLPRDWIFTFGYDHVHPIDGSPLRDKYVVIYGTSSVAREEMMCMFGQKWSHQYPTEQAAGVVRFNLKQLDLSAFSPDPTVG